jgi:hypothetical protein
MIALVMPSAVHLIVEIQDLSIQGLRRRRKQVEIEECVEGVQDIFF